MTTNNEGQWEGDPDLRSGSTVRIIRPTTVSSSTHEAFMKVLDAGTLSAFFFSGPDYRIAPVLPNFNLPQVDCFQAVSLCIFL